MPSATVNSPRSLGRVKLLSSDDENILDTNHTINMCTILFVDHFTAQSHQPLSAENSYIPNTSKLHFNKPKKIPQKSHTVRTTVAVA